jgi:hypothetical protein
MPRFDMSLSHAQFAALAACALVSAVSAPASAQERDLAAAKKRFAEGKSLFDAGKFADAARVFLEAYELSGKPELLYNVAQAYKQAGEAVEAQRYYKRYLDELPDAPNAEEVLEHIIQLQQEIAKRFARIQVDSGDEEGKDVFVDAEPAARCQTPCALVLKPGDYKVRVADRGPARPINAKAGDNRPESFAVAPTPRGKLLLSADKPGAVARINGQTYALPMTDPVELDAKRWPVEVSAGETRWRGELDLKDGQTLNLLVGLDQERPPEGASLKRVGAYTLGGAGVALLLGGVFMGVQAGDTYDLLDAQSRRGAVEPGLIDQGDSQQFVANTLLVTGTLALLGGAGLFAWDVMDAAPDEEVAPPSEEPSEEPAAKPVEPTPPRSDDLI